MESIFAREFQHFAVVAPEGNVASQETTLLLQKHADAKWPHPYEVLGALVDVESQLGFLGSTTRNARLLPDKKGDWFLEYSGEEGKSVALAFLELIERRMVEKNRPKVPRKNSRAAKRGGDVCSHVL